MKSLRVFRILGALYLFRHLFHHFLDGKGLGCRVSASSLVCFLLLLAVMSCWFSYSMRARAWRGEIVLVHACSGNNMSESMMGE
jgi:hypothetical protein